MESPKIRTNKTGMVLCCPTDWSTAHIALACGVQRSTVLKIYKRYGMPRPRPGNPPRNLEKIEFEIRYGVTRRFWRVHKLETMKACHETARDWYVMTYKESRGNAR